MKSLNIGGLSLAALLVAHCAGMLDLVSMPLWVGGLVEHYGLTPQAAGQLVTTFLLGVVITSVCLARVFSVLPRKRIAVVGFCVAGVCFGKASLEADFTVLLGLHALAGCAVGASLSMAHGAMGQTSRPHRVFALAGLALGFTATLLLATVPLMVARWGGAVMFQTFAVLMALAAVALLMGYPSGKLISRAPANGSKPVRFTRSVWYVIAGISLMTLNNAMLFGFLDVIGKLRGFTADAINGVFIALGLVNLLIVSPLAMYLERRVSPEHAVLVGPVAQGLLSAVIANSGSFIPWAIAAACYTGVQIITHTFTFALLARIEPSHRAVAATPAMLMGGAAVGPVLGGMLGQHFGFGSLSVASTVLALLSLWMFANARRAPLAVRVA